MAAVQPERRRSAALNIGEVLATLAEDFPSMTASKIRFLEDKGLISPHRTPSGYRQYADHDVDRLRFVLALQRDQYLPLKVIKDYLDAIDRGERPESLPGGLSIAPRPVSDELGAQLAASRPRRLTETQLRAESGASARLVEAMLSFGLITAEDGRFDEHALTVARSCAALVAHGIEPRHLRPFQTAAEREMGLIERAVAPSASRPDSASRARAAEEARELSEAFMTLHRALVHGMISRMDG
ncbi:MerR family transcriptional regulator [Sinomonas cellulolyticus]|jgi:DNA-binding transcriptional MerR regulator|uniref:MerR family transcriptional regulator n=1 Tax=Sinomonas cellulolyticus TaxID=2801916 RepID=A0ABS1K1N8_9MICC|nr:MULTISPECIES: MerR family transcriptional regulator [Sinomonas]MBL0705530.1 MerR family transcriptional regulator [Sinomonas cellulolyticus]GHG41646.1 MerR family transcriptional regulator [Sinomonas sp. KCTC 49339]